MMNKMTYYNPNKIVKYGRFICKGIRRKLDVTLPEKKPRISGGNTTLMGISIRGYGFGNAVEITNQEDYEDFSSYLFRSHGDTVYLYYLPKSKKKICRLNDLIEDEEVNIDVDILSKLHWRRR